MTKRLRSEAQEERESPAKKLMRSGGQNDDVGEDILAWLLIDDDRGGELFRDGEVAASDELAELLAGAEEGEAGAAAMKMRFTENPYCSTAERVFQTAPSSYVTINGNEETCGSSFSDWDSSVMASVDIGGLGCFCRLGFEPEPELQAPELGGACKSRAEEGVDCGFDWDGDEEWLAGFMDEVLMEQGSLA